MDFLLNAGSGKYHTVIMVLYLFNCNYLSKMYSILKENLLTDWIFLLLMQILCTHCLYLTNWMFVQARRQSWSLPSQDLPFPILADKPNNLSIILIILADENFKHLIVIILQCPSVLVWPQ